MRRALALAAGVALSGAALAEPDWSKVPERTITVFHPGVASIEWAFTGTQHGGARAMRRNRPCAACHDDETADLGAGIVSGGKLEPEAAAVKGSALGVPVAVQAAFDASQLYLRFRWTQPAGAPARKRDGKNAVKLAVMLDDGKVEYGAIGGCWASCHHDLRSMPDVNANAARHELARALGILADGPTKYLKESRTALEMQERPLGGWDKVRPEREIADLLAAGKFLELWQFRSAEAPRRGYVLEARRLEDAPGLARGGREGEVWTVTFTRALAGGPGRHALEPGKTVHLGFALHDGHSDARYHLVSLGYSLGLDDAKADLNAVRQ